MQIIHYVPCSCQLLDSCECGLTRPTTGLDNSGTPGPGPCPRPISNKSSPSKQPSTNKNIIPIPPPQTPPPTPPPTPPTSSTSSLSSVPEELTTVDRIYCEARRAGQIVVIITRYSLCRCFFRSCYLMFYGQI